MSILGFLKSKYTVIIPNVIILSLFIYDEWFFILDCIPRDMVDFKRAKISKGIISRTFFNENDHNHFYIYINEGSERILLKPYYDFYGSDLSKVVVIGDTIFKERDSMSFILKNNSKHKLIKFNCEIGSVEDR